jgi:GT2 family glycosyltransferase
MNLFVRKKQFDEIGGFNESLVTCEDVDFSYRLKTHGSILSDIRIEVIHLGEAATIRQFIRKEIWRGRSNLQGILSHGLKSSEIPSLSIPIYFGFIMIFFFFASTFAVGTHAFGIAAFLFVLPPLLGAYKVRNRIVSKNALFRLLFLLQVYFICRTIATFKGFIGALLSKH